MNLNEGQLIKAPFFDGVGEVKKFRKKTGYFLLEVVLRKNMEFKTFRLTQAKMDQRDKSTNIRKRHPHVLRKFWMSFTVGFFC